MNDTWKKSVMQATVSVGRFCVYCGKRASHADHIIPSVLGGKDCAENLVPACASCNCKKGPRRLKPEIEKELLLKAFIDAPLVNEVARVLYHKQSKSNRSIVPLEFV